MGCGNEVTNEDFRKIEEAMQGKHGGLDKSYLTAEKWEEVNKNIKEPQQEKERIDRQVQKMKDAHRLQKMKDIYGAKPINDVIIEYERGDVSEQEAERLAERIKNSDPNDALLISREEDPSPFFTPGFNDVGDKVEFSEDKELPSGKVYSPVQPTFENLGNLLDKRNPYNPWDERVTWHHNEQNEEPIMVIEERLHKQESGALHGHIPLDRDEWDRRQRGEFMKEIARQYLGSYSEHKVVLDALKEKARKAWSIRKNKE